MGVRDLSLRDLTYLVAVDDERHFGRAAESCYVSQPSLSAQIRKVEQVLGTRIFERDRRRVLLTVAGDRLVEQARRVLAEADRLGELARIAQGVLTGPFRLGLIATLGPYLLPYLLEPLRKGYPELELIVTEDLTESLLSSLRQGELDAVLLSPLDQDGTLELRRLFFEPFLLAVPADHPLARCSPLEMKDLCREEMVLLHDGHCLRDQALELCPSARAGRERLQTASLETLRHLVASGAGYSLVPRLAVREDPQLARLLVYRLFDADRPGREIGLTWRKGSPRDADMNALCEVVRDHLPEGVETLF